MKTIEPAFPENEVERIKSLRRYDILDAQPDSSLEHIVRLAARLLHVPIAIISLVDTDQILLKASVGLNSNVHEIVRESGFCSSAIQTDDVYVVEDAVNDRRTMFNSLVAGELGIRFYAAAPLKVKDGSNLGTICIIDRHPRILSAEESQLLVELSTIVVDRLELRLEAREVDARHSQLLSLVAHEIKNSLTTIPAYTELIKSEPSANVFIVPLCDHILLASRRMNELVKEMLEMAELQNDQLRLRKSEFDMALIVGRVAGNNSVLANAKHQKIFLDMVDKLIVYADELKISEIADNLINNAIKYSPFGATINVKLARNNQKFILEVVDEGPGLNESDKAKIFTPFTRLSARPTGGEDSTGIGLSIVKLLVNAHGGLVYADNNQEKQGASFKVEIPVH